MKNILSTILFFSIAVLSNSFFSQKANASHIVGMDLKYNYVSGNTYKIILIAYGDCGPSSAAAFSTLPSASPRICIYDGSTYIGQINLTIQPPTTGENIAKYVICPRDTDSTTCSSSSYPYPGIKKFVYTGNYTLPGTSHHYRFLYCGYMGGASAAGRAAAITNIVYGSLVSLVDTLDNTWGHNSSPALTVEPIPFFCNNNPDSYNPVAVDPDGDSMRFMLTPGIDGTSGGASCPSTPLPNVTYTGGFTFSNPLSVVAGSFSFDAATGQINFTPNAIQRSLVVYNIQEYRHDTFVGTSQREMNFIVIGCTNTPPTGIMDSGINGSIEPDSVHFDVCQNTGPFSFIIKPHEPDLTNVIYVTSTGLPIGCTMTVTGDSTNAPRISISWTSTGVPAGIYTFYLRFQDNHCPVNGTHIAAYTIRILPVPNINFSIVSQNTCTTLGVVSAIPGGSGSPWNVFVDSAGVLVDSAIGISSVVNFTLGPGTDTFFIYTGISKYCGRDTFFTLAPIPPFNLTATFTNPSYCGANDGTIVMTALQPGSIDTVYYTFNGVWQPPATYLIPSDSLLTMSGLQPGTYVIDSVKYGKCVYGTFNFTLVNPPFQISYLSSSNPTACGVCNGQIVVHGLHPGMTDTLYYNNGATADTAYGYINADSTIVINGLCGGTYTNFYAKSGTCITNTIGPATLVTPIIKTYFDTFIHLGCIGDTIVCLDSSANGTVNGFAIDSGLIYKWTFGDGSPVDTSTNPKHIYYTQGTYTIKLVITNFYHCYDSLSKDITLNNFVKAGYSMAPNPICQGNTVTFTDTSTGSGNHYLWNFGDSSFSHLVSPTHFYPNTGIYTVTLIATNTVPCSDTATQILFVDSLSPITILATDSVFCAGGGSTLTGVFSNIGNLGFTWQFGDGDSIVNVNPVMHSYTDSGIYNVTLQAYYRACRNVSTTRPIWVFPYPSVYIGPDTFICPGSNPVVLVDKRNAGRTDARWLWNTSETTPSIVVSKDDHYWVKVRIHGCESADTVWVKKDCYVDIPNVFTPNGDGMNDYFFPRQLLSRSLTSFKMEIFNRWGQLLYQTNALDGRGWDGNFNDVPQPEGVYIYIIDAAFKDGQMEHHQGNITLLK